MAIRHFLRLSDLSATEIHTLIARARALKAARHDFGYRPFVGRTLAMIFTKNSTRTRVSFEAGMARMGGHALFLHASATQLGRSEPIADTARVLSRMCDAIMIRNDSQADQQEMAAHSQVPVINGLSDLRHPCQLLADLQTWVECHGEIRGKTVAWVGDGNNVCNSWIEAAKLLDFELRVASPNGFAPNAELLAANASHVRCVDDPHDAVRGAQLVATDTWTSMGQEADAEARLRAFGPYQVTAELMALAAPNAIFQHCLPATRGKEVSADVIDGPQSVVWDEAENRMWAQLALLELLLGCRPG